MRMLVNSDKGGCAELSSPALLFSVLFGFVCFYGVYIPWRTECKENLIEIRPETGWALRRRLMLVSKQLAGQSRRNHQLSHWPCWSDLYHGLFSEALHSSCAPRSWGSGRVIPQTPCNWKKQPANAKREPVSSTPTEPSNRASSTRWLNLIPHCNSRGLAASRSWNPPAHSFPMSREVIGLKTFCPCAYLETSYSSGTSSKYSECSIPQCYSWRLYWKSTVSRKPCLMWVSVTRITSTARVLIKSVTL